MTPVPAETVWTTELLNSMPVEVKEIQAETRSDSTLALVLKFVQCGWPSRNTDKALKPCLSRKEELRIQDGCLLWGNPVVVPPKARERVMEELHETHPGICPMKSLTRSCIWWPNIDSDLEMKVRNCEVCQVNRKLPPQAPLYPSIRLQLNYGGPFVGKMFLIVVEAHSKWLEAFPMNTSTTSANIEKLRIIEFDPWTSRNGSYRQRQQLCEQSSKISWNGIRNVRTAPYHPSSKGLAERAVQTFIFCPSSSLIWAERWQPSNRLPIMTTFWAQKQENVCTDQWW